MRKTKIVGTIGPVSRNYEMIKKLAAAGLNVCRINMSHDPASMQEEIFDIVGRVRRETGKPLPIMLDTRGPEIRIGKFKDGVVNLKAGQTFSFLAEEIEGDETKVSISVPEVVEIIKPGQKILGVNGLIEFKVTEVTDKEIITIVENSAELSNRKSLSIPNIKLNVPYLNEKDEKDIIWGLEKGIDYIAASFISDRGDVLDIRRLIEKNNSKCKIIAKIENNLGIKNLEEILEVADGIMVARGDLGVEVPLFELPALQKEMIKKANAAGKIVITATEMLESMINSPRPTRAEATDVANAVYDGSTAVMLSAETAVGKYAIEAVSYMNKISLATEKSINYKKRYSMLPLEMSSAEESISRAAVSASFGFKKEVKALVAWTESGRTAGKVSKYKPDTNILAVTNNEEVYRQLDLEWGVIPVLHQNKVSTDQLLEDSEKIAKESGLAKAGDRIVITAGSMENLSTTDLLKISLIK